MNVLKCQSSKCEDSVLCFFFLNKVMKSTRPGLEESHLHNIVEYECRMAGAERLAYPPVVASGPMANTLHYINNSQVLR